MQFKLKLYFLKKDFFIFFAKEIDLFSIEKTPHL
jgi:hypothetical protein